MRTLTHRRPGTRPRPGATIWHTLHRAHYRRVMTVQPRVSHRAQRSHQDDTVQEDGGSEWVESDDEDDGDGDEDENDSSATCHSWPSIREEDDGEAKSLSDGQVLERKTTERQRVAVMAKTG